MSSPSGDYAVVRLVEALYALGGGSLAQVCAVVQRDGNDLAGLNGDQELYLVEAVDVVGDLVFLKRALW